MRSGTLDWGSAFFKREDGSETGAPSIRPIQRGPLLVLPQHVAYTFPKSGSSSWRASGGGGGWDDGSVFRSQVPLGRTFPDAGGTAAADCGRGAAASPQGPPPAG